MIVAFFGLAACRSDSGAPAGSPSPAPEVTTPAPSPTPTAALLWPSPSNPLELTVKAGLQPERKEGLEYHVHAHLDVFIDGAPVLVPAGIGIDIANPAVRQGQDSGGSTYGGIEECDKPCISPLHTHDVTGVLHTESLVRKPNRLGQFFTEWGVRLDDRCTGEHCKPEVSWAVYVDGQPYEGDNPADIRLTDLKEIAIVIGTPPPTIPSEFDFTGKA